ncbi:glycosyltransferase [Pseudorhodobacter ferrugineus]|uniref:glycosyltransferase n=1 Tax=Pseudorhodobacter ferrugineus TaxID=77008 RepID=UPI0003B7941C|nr:glycosyltransferase [Pseudorhodobacter ferrugineus]
MPFGMHGLGQELRDKVRALRSVGIDVCVLEQNYSSLRRRIVEPDIEALLSAKPVYPVNLICHNLPATHLIQRKNPELLDGRYNIGAPYWEYPEIPGNHLPGFDALDEIWTSNSFLTDCFRPVADVPIIEMPLHLPFPQDTDQPALDGGDAFVFGYVFDFNSMASRKDPTVLILAFLECFGATPEAPVELVLKYSMEKSRWINPARVEDFLRLAALDPRIKLIPDAYSTEQMAALMQSFDAYVSPHRAEGLGRGIIEAMMRGKAVAATKYSGPAQFLDLEWSYPLDFYASHVGAEAFGDTKPGFSWVEVELESLVAAMTALAADPQAAARKGAIAAKMMRDRHGPKAFGMACLERLRAIEAKAADRVLSPADCVVQRDCIKE